MSYIPFIYDYIARQNLAAAVDRARVEAEAEAEYIRFLQEDDLSNQLPIVPIPPLETELNLIYTLEVPVAPKRKAGRPKGSMGNKDKPRNIYGRKNTADVIVFPKNTVQGKRVITAEIIDDLKKARRENNYTYKALAQMYGTSEQTIFRILHNQHPADKDYQKPHSTI